MICGAGLHGSALAYYLTHDELLMRFVFAAQEAARAAAAQPLKSKERAARAQRQPGARPYVPSTWSATGTALVDCPCA